MKNMLDEDKVLIFFIEKKVLYHLAPKKYQSLTSYPPLTGGHQ